MKLALLAIVTASTFAQTISFSPAGAEALRALTGKRINGVQIVSVVVCGPGSITGGAIYTEAVKKGFSPMAPIVAAAIVTNTVSKNWRNYALEAFRVASIVGVGLGTGGVVSMSSQTLSALAIGHQIGDEVSGRLQDHLPNPTPLLSNLIDPAQTMDLSSGCKSGLMLSLYGKSIRSTPASVDLTPSKPADPSPSPKATSWNFEPRFEAGPSTAAIAERIYRKGA